MMGVATSSHPYPNIPLDTRVRTLEKELETQKRENERLKRELNEEKMKRAKEHLRDFSIAHPSQNPQNNALPPRPSPPPTRDPRYVQIPKTVLEALRKELEMARFMNDRQKKNIEDLSKENRTCDFHASRKYQFEDDTGNCWKCGERDRAINKKYEPRLVSRGLYDDLDNPDEYAFVTST